MKRSRGFTLLELMIVVAIIALLASVAMFAYGKQVRKSHRADAHSTLGGYALKLEKYRTNNINYGADATAAATAAGTTNNAATPGGYYTVAFSFPTTGNCPGGQAKGVLNSFIMTANAVGDQAKDTGCTALIFNNDCGTVTKTPADCW